MDQNEIIRNEEKILKFWEQNRIFEKTLEKNKKKRHFVFYEGPPSANASPHVGHVLARVFKDLIPRYKTMRGFYVERKAGWDTHGLPIELEVEKALGIKSKREIEKYGIEKFNQRCRENVWRYKEEWENLTKRIGYWLDLKNPYITYDNKYIESLWWIIKQIYAKKLLARDYKVVPYCPRCGTALSSHEVAQGYKNISEKSVYVRFNALSPKSEWKNTSIISWTTTPWTLPGNAALAVNPKLDYICVPDPYEKGHHMVLGLKNFQKLLAKKIFPEVYLEKFKSPQSEWTGIEIFKGTEMLGIGYQPLFAAPELKSSNSYKIYPADFVTADEGTGIVHIASMYGEDDYLLGKKFGLPNFHTVTEEGKFIGKMPAGLANQYVKSEKAESFIFEFLKQKNLFLAEESYEHDYPFCWRCSSPLLYYAKESWFVKISKLKNQLIKNNKTVNWIPAHLKQGRFGEWLHDIKDWAFSRERYWGTPLPLWHCQKCGKIEAIGSLDDLNNFGKFNNDYFIMRHGLSDANLKDTISSWPEIKSRISHLTLKGMEQVRKTAQKLKKEKIDLIFASDLIRIKETVDIVQKEIDFPKSKIKFEPRIREYKLGAFNGKPTAEHRAYYSSRLEEFFKKAPGGESLTDVKKRMVDFIFWLEKKYKNKNILVVSHGDPMWMLKGAFLGFGNNELLEKEDRLYLDYGQCERLEVKNIPLNSNYELDLHKPYIDNLKIYCGKCGSLMKRTSEVADVWFDSGAMPFAQAHWPFAFVENQESRIKNQELLFPADYICEAIDQTRGWFYTLLAVSSLLGKGAPYGTVISTGHVLDQHGLKMSKSKGNVVNPWDILNQYGADALRWYFFTVNSPGDPKNFDANDIAKKYREFISTLWNVYIFYTTYALKCHNLTPRNAGVNSRQTSRRKSASTILDKWIISKLNELIASVTKKLDKYEIVISGREIENFIDDLSNWYIRRSRRRFQKPQSKSDYDNASKTLAFVLLEFSKLIAPFVPFIADTIYTRISVDNKRMSADTEKSVHLCDWPKADKNLIDKKLNNEMDLARRIVALGLKARARAGVKVRQPLRELRITNQESRIKEDELKRGFMDLIKDELNIKHVIVVKEGIEKLQNWVEETDGKIMVALDTYITPELQQEGWAREIVRNIQEMRKDAGFKPKHTVMIQWSSSDDSIKAAVTKWSSYIKSETLADETKEGAREKQVFAVERNIKINNRDIWIGIRKI